MHTASGGRPASTALRRPVLFLNLPDVIEYGAPMDLMRWLKTHPGDVDARLSDGDTLLVRAVRNANYTAIATMLEAGATPSAEALCLAVDMRDHATVAQLLVCGAGRDTAGLAEAAMRCRSPYMFELFSVSGVRAGATGADGRTLLHNAARRGNVALAEHLVKVHRMNPRQLCGHGLTPYQYACMPGVAEYPMPEIGPWPAVNPAQEYFIQFES